MRYSPEHKTNARAKLLATAGALVKEKGFGTTGVDKLMAAAGVTSGAFYSHFGSKPELLKAIVENELVNTIALFDGSTPESLLKAIKFYLSESHVQHPEIGCMIPSLASEVARADDDTKQTFERLILQLKDILQSQLAGKDDAWAVIAQAVGAVVIARAMASDSSRKALLKAAKKQIEEILDKS